MLLIPFKSVEMLDVFFYDHSLFLMSLLFYHCTMNSLSLVKVFGLKCIFFWLKYGYTHIFWYPPTWNILFCSYALSLCVSSELKWISFRMELGHFFFSYSSSHSALWWNQSIHNYYYYLIICLLVLYLLCSLSLISTFVKWISMVICSVSPFLRFHH